MTPQRLPGTLLLGLASLARAQTPDGRGEDLQSLKRLMETPVAVASHGGASLLTTPSTVSIVDRDTLERFGIQTLAEAVELVAGMSKLRTSFFRDVLTSRGVLQEHYANRTLLLIEGVPVWEAVSGAYAPGRIGIQDVERIEVLRGPASVLYGSNAYAGAINVILRQPSQGAGEARLGLGDQGGREEGVLVHRVGPGWRVFLSAGGHREEGAHLSVPGEGGVMIPVAEHLDNRSANLLFRSIHHSLLVNAYESKYPHLGIALTPATGGGKEFINQGLLGSYGFVLATGRTRFQYGLAWDGYRREYDTSPDGTDARRAEGYRLSQTLALLWEAVSGFSLEWGGSHELRRSDSFQTFNPSTGLVKDENRLRNIEVRETSASLQAQFTRPEWSFLAGTRYTRDENFGSNLSSRATLVRLLGASSSVKLIWGQSYRAPTMLEQYTLVPGFLYGNLGAKPETSESLELAFLAQPGPLLFQALVYGATYRDKLVRLPSYPTFTTNPADTSRTYANGASFQARGAEVELRYEGPEGLSGFLNADYVHGNRGDELPGVRGYNFAFVPTYAAKLGLSQRLGAWRGSLLVHHAAGARGPLGPLPSQSSIDLFAAFEQTFRNWALQHALSARNLGATEQHYPEYVRRNINDIPDGLGRRVTYTLTLRF